MASASSLSGFTVGGWLLGELLGAGEFGAVYAGSRTGGGGGGGGDAPLW